MKELLSREELGDLLTAVRSGPAPQNTTPDPAAANVRPHDFRRPNPFSRRQLQRLQHIHDGAAVAFSRTLSAYFRAPVEVRLVTVEVATYGGFSAALPTPVCLQPFAATQDPHRCLLTLDLSIALGMVERLLGGSGRASDQINPLTPVEQAIIRAALDALLHALATEWSRDAPRQLEGHDLAMDPKAVHILGIQESVVQIAFAVGGDIGVGDINLCLPLPVAKSLVPRDGTEPASPGDQTDALKRAIAATPVRVAVELGRSTIALSDLLELSPGHVIRLDQPVDQPLNATIEGKPLLAGKPGLVGNRIGLRITRASLPPRKGT